MRLVYLEYFRAIAVISVVLGHSYATWAIDTIYEKTIANLFDGGTILFVFISGFLFHYRYYSTFQYREFIVNKLKFIFIPYLFLHTLGFVYFIVDVGELPYQDYFTNGKNLNYFDYFDYFKLFFQYLWQGHVISPYWFIPYIMITFALSPIFLKQLTLKKYTQVAIVIILIIISSIVQRPTSNLGNMQSLIYFTPIFMLGILFSANKDQIIEYIKGKSLVLGLSVISVSLMQILIIGENGPVTKESIFSYNGIDIIIFQKILLCFFLVSVLQKFETKKIPLLKFIAAKSLSIYFLHYWIIYFFYKSEFYQILHFLPGFVLFIITALIALTTSILIALSFTFILGKKSRYLIGS